MHYVVDMCLNFKCINLYLTMNNSIMEMMTVTCCIELCASKQSNDICFARVKVSLPLISKMVRLIPRDVANQIVGMAAAGLQHQAIAARYGVHRNSIRNILRRHKRTGDVRHRQVTGRPRVTTPAQDRYIRTIHLR